MSFREEFKQNATLLSFCLIGFVAMLSEDFRSLLKENTFVVLPYFIIIAVAEIKEHLQEHFDDIVDRIIKTDRY